MGPHAIVRQVAPNGNGGWMFTITKTGSTATIDPLPSEPDPFYAAFFHDRFMRLYSSR
jgi:hypothetical protein